jgi:hypothetical protein
MIGEPLHLAKGDGFMWHLCRKLCSASLLVLFLVTLAGAEKPRVIVSTDIGGEDNDDYQSMVHFLVYADLFDIEGLISSPPGAGRKSNIEQVLNAYNTDYNNLKTYGPYPTHAALLAVTKQGATAAGGPSSGRSTEGSKHIIAAANSNDARPLWILVWGSITDVAQALYDAPNIKSKIRVYSIGSWNTSQDRASRDYIYNNHADLWWIETNTTFRGMYEGGDQSGDLANTTFVSTHVKGHGALGAFYPGSSIKMGDTPSVLYMLSPLAGGVGNWNDPTRESWGGQFKKTSHGPNYWTDVAGSRTTDAVSINKWREPYLRHWQTRMDRCKAPNSGSADTTPPGAPKNVSVIVGQ